MKRALLIATALFLAFVVYGIYDAGRDERPAPSANSDITFGAGHANGRRITFRSWSADYDRIVSNADQTVLDITGIHNGVIYKAGKPYLYVRAAHLSVNTVTRDFSAIGPLHAETAAAKPGRTFDTTFATWNDAEQKLTFSRRVVIHSTADPPLVVGDMTFEVKTGKVVLDDVEGPLRLK